MGETVRVDRKWLWKWDFLYYIYIISVAVANNLLRHISKSKIIKILIEFNMINDGMLQLHHFLNLAQDLSFYILMIQAVLYSLVFSFCKNFSDSLATKFLNIHFYI